MTGGDWLFLAALAAIVVLARLLLAPLGQLLVGALVFGTWLLWAATMAFRAGHRRGRARRARAAAQREAERRAREGALTRQEWLR